MNDRRAGRALLHPLALAAIAVLVLNDHVLKPTWPGPLTGKLSDFAGLAFFPLVLFSAWELVLERLGRFERPTHPGFACTVTALVFAIAKLTPWGADLFRWGLGAAQWPFRGSLDPVAFVADPTDLVALPAVLVAWWVQRESGRRDLQPNHGHQ